MERNEDELTDYGTRKLAAGSRRRKGALDYATQYQSDLSSEIIMKNGLPIHVLVCKYCSVPIGARNDRIRDHLNSKRHLKLKSEALSRYLNIHQPIESYVNNAMTFEQHPPVGIMQTTDDPNPTPSQNALQQCSNEIPNENTGVDSVAGPAQTINPLVDVQSTPPAPPPPKKEPLCFKMTWETHPGVFRDAFCSYQKQGHFTDVTLSAEGKGINCHKLVLASYSDYFLNVIKESPNPHPVIFLKDTSYKELEYLVQFMYEGEVILTDKEVKPFLRICNNLRVDKPKAPSPVDNNNYTERTGRNPERSRIPGTFVIPLPTATVPEKPQSLDGDKRKSPNGLEIPSRNSQTNDSSVRGEHPGHNIISSNSAFGDESQRAGSFENFMLEQILRHLLGSNQSPMMTSEEGSQQRPGESESRKRKLDSARNADAGNASSSKTPRISTQEQNMSRRCETVTSSNSGSDGHSDGADGIIDLSPGNSQVQQNDSEQNSITFYSAPIYENITPPPTLEEQNQ